MITPAYSLTATERVLPRLALDFTTANLDARITFTRSGNTATVVDSSGLVSTINADTPRFDYDPVSLQCLGLLVEESRQNLCLQSENFGTTWSNSDSAETTDVAVSPSGVQNADKVYSSDGVDGYISQVINLTSGVSYTVSVFAKEAGFDFYRIYLSAAGGDKQASYTLTGNGETSAVSSGATATIKNFGNGWYRCSITFTAVSTGAAGLRIYPQRFTTGNANQDGIYLWGAQLEAGAFATSYIPTEATAVTRNADVATMTGTNFSDWFNASEGAFYVQATPTDNVAVQRVLLDVAADATNRMSLIQHTSSSLANYFVFVGGAIQVNAYTTCTVGNIKSCFAYKTDSFAFDTDVGALVSDTAGSVVSPTFMKIGARQDNGLPINGHMQKILYWPQRLINNEIQAFSKG